MQCANPFPNCNQNPNSSRFFFLPSEMHGYFHALWSMRVILNLFPFNKVNGREEKSIRTHTKQSEQNQKILCLSKNNSKFLSKIKKYY